jgi:prepilin signal peptidase PulO-like enzyme (type II secretory pathway)
MSACEDVHESPPERLFVRGHVFTDVVFALLGCVGAFYLFGFQAALLVSVWWCLSIIIIRSDLDDFIIPNWATAGIALAGILYAVVSTPGVSGHLSAVAGEIAGPAERAIVTFLGVAAFAWVFVRITGREGLGFGDVKLSGALAVWLGAYGLIVTLELASFTALGLVAVCYLRNKQTFHDGVIPFGAFLAPAAWIVFVIDNISVASGPWHALIG